MQDNFMKARDAVKSITVGWNLGNSLDARPKPDVEITVDNQETAWGNPKTTPEIIRAVKDAGFNAVRFPVTWQLFTDKKGNVDKAFMDRVVEIAGMITDMGMLCAVDIHHDGGAHGWIEADRDNYEKNEERFRGLVRSIAETFRDFDDRLMLESVNEMLDSGHKWNFPDDDSSYDYLNRYNQLFVDTVRATGGNNAYRNLIVQTYGGASRDRTLENFVLPTDSTADHLIVEIHNYDPEGFSWTDVDWMPVRSEWGSDEDMKFTDDLFRRISAFSHRIGAPLIIGEIGSEDKGNDAERAKHAAYYTKKCRENDIRLFWWDLNRFTLIDRVNLKPIHTDVIKALISE